MKASELREKSVEELQVQLQELYKDQFNYRMQNSSGQLGQVHLVGEVRRDIARVKTLITEKQSTEDQSAEDQSTENQSTENQSTETKKSESE